MKHADWGASSIFLKNTETLLLIGGEGKDNNSRSHTHALTYQKYSESEWHWDERDKEHHLGGFQLLDLIIRELKSHITCYKSMPLIG